MVPVERLDGIARHPDVFDFSLDGDVQFLSNGWARRFYTGVPITQDYEHDAETGNRVTPSSPVVVAIIDEQDLNTAHVGWRDWAGGPSRVLSTDFCEQECAFWPFGCQMICNGTANGPNFGHGNQVASILAANIQQGQDPAYPGLNTSSQQQRSGLAKEAAIRYFRIDSGAGPEATRVAIEDSVAAGVDIINLSLAFNHNDASTWCNGFADVGGVRGAIRAATEAGVLVVAAAGNQNTWFKCVGTTCNVLFPANSTHAMAIGGLAGDGTHLENKVPLSNSSCGWGYSPASDGAWWWFPMIDVATYGQVYGHPFNSQTSGPSSYATSGAQSFTGTSAAAPVAASVAALVRQWMYNHGWSEFASAYAVRLNMLLSSNGAVVDYDPSASPQHSLPYFSATKIGRHLGYGALRYHYFSYPFTDQLGPVGGWGIHKLNVTAGQTVTLPAGWGGYESNAVTGWKFAAIANEDSYGAMPVGVLKVVDACAPGRPVIQQSAAAGRWKVFLNNAPNQIHGKCLEVDFYFASTSGVDEVWIADYYFSNSKAAHLIP